jgi:hypothetical protein
MHDEFQESGPLDQTDASLLPLASPLTGLKTKFISKLQSIQ